MTGINLSPDKILENYAPGDADAEGLSRDKRLNNLLQSVVTEVRLYAKDQIKHIKRLTQIGLALSVEKDIGKLLELIVDGAKDLSNADAGTLYIADWESQCLRFEIMQNTSMNIRMGGTSGHAITLPHVPLFIENKPNFSNVCSYAALKGETVNIQDVYAADGFDFSGTRNYDKSTGYHCKSMLVIPMKNHENRIIGVLQLLNAMDSDTNEIIAFSRDHVDLIAALASQAAVALTNTQLIDDLKNLFQAFIKSIATAIDEKSPHTGGHITRVVDLTMMIAEAINGADSGPFENFSFTGDELEELRMSAWMHDVGKITTPEHIMDKSTKLQCIFDGTEMIRTRFQLIEGIMEKEYLETKLRRRKNSDPSSGEICGTLEKAHADKLQTLEKELAFVLSCTDPSQLMDADKLLHLREIAGKTYECKQKTYPYLTEDEVNKLSIRKGTLDEAERKAIENHARMTYKILNHLPFPERLSNVPRYSGAHHERPDGKGYPDGISGADLPLQARILAIADVFEALTARDRPYKAAIKISNVLQIMEQMKKDNQIDPDVYSLFVRKKLFEKYMRRKEQVRHTQ